MTQDAVAVRFAIETWSPEYGAPVGGEVMGETDAEVDAAFERPLADWAPVAPAVASAARVLFVDGVQRIDARVWVDDGTGASLQGICASWAAGVVCCDGEAAVVAAEVRRGVLCPGDDVGSIATAHGRYRSYPVADVPGGDPLGQALGRARGDLEGRVAVEAGRGGDLLVVDGPLGDRRHIDGAVGYIKAHHVAYLAPPQQAVVGALEAGERTPLFRIGAQRFRWSWYVRLPGPATHAWWGIVRCEAAGDLPRDEAAARADLVAATLPRFASQPYNDARAPQNLHPIAGLERELKRRLGDPLLLDRALRTATAAGPTAA